jgi:hypothetical protein
MAIFRKRQIEAIAQMTVQELEEYLGSLPASQEQIEDLFDYLEYKLEKDPCDHSLRYAMQYMMENRLNFPKLTAWLNENGGVCDCKILDEITPAWRNVFDRLQDTDE